MAENPHAEGADEAGGKKKKGGGKLILIVLVAALGGGGFFMQKQKAAKAAEQAEDWEKNPVYETVVYSMDTQTVNLADGDRYVRCMVAIGFEMDPIDAAFFRTQCAPKEEGGGGGHGGGEGGAEAPEPENVPPKDGPGDEVIALAHHLNGEEVKTQLQDVLISELTSRTFDELQTLEGKELFKAALVQAFNEILGHGSHGGDSGKSGKNDKDSEHQDEEKGDGEGHESEDGPVKAVYLRDFVMQ